MAEHQPHMFTIAENSPVLLLPQRVLEHFQFPAYLLNVFLLRSEVHRLSPELLCLLKVPGFEVQISQVFLDCGVVPDDFIGLEKIFFSICKVVQLEESPAQRIEKSPVVRIDRQRLLDILDCFLQPDPTVRKHIADVVQGIRVV